MSRISELLAAKRASQIALLEGEDRAGPSDDEIVAAQTAASTHLRKKRVKTPRLRLGITDHARRRMGQRGVRPEIPRLIWCYGEPLASRDEGVTHYVVSDKALRAMSATVRRTLTPYRQCGAIITDACEERGPVLVTLIRYDNLHMDYSNW